jgi:hypothetical protein
MTLGFTTQFADGTPTLFRQKILRPFDKGLAEMYPDDAAKIHTFRLGNRWRAGMKMHMVTGNRTQDRYQFNTGYPDLEYCHGVQKCVIHYNPNPLPHFLIEVEGHALDPGNELLFMLNDGFNSPDRFQEWFGHPYKALQHVGQIVHFSAFRY